MKSKLIGLILLALGLLLIAAKPSWRDIVTVGSGLKIYNAATELVATFAEDKSVDIGGQLKAPVIVSTGTASVAGNVVFGATDPVYKLLIYGAASENPNFQMGLAGTGVMGGMKFLENSTVRGSMGYGDNGAHFTGALTDSLSIRSENALHLGAGGDGLIMTLTGGKVGMATNTNINNVLTLPQGSATDPIADAWGTYSIESSKVNIRDATEGTFKEVKDRIASIPMKVFSRASNDIKYATADKFKQSYVGFNVDDKTNAIPFNYKLYDCEGRLVGRNDSALIGDMIAALQEQQKQIDALEERVAKLEGR